MKKTNLEVHMNEIIFDVITKKRDLDIEMFTIYQRETGKDPSDIRDIVEWFADVPRETLELAEDTYNFINEYFREMSGTIRKCDEPLDWYVALDVLLKLNVIPSKYQQMPFNKFVKIIRIKKVKK